MTHVHVSQNKNNCIAYWRNSMSYRFRLSYIFILVMYVTGLHAADTSFDKRCLHDKQTAFCKLDGKNSDQIHQLQHYLGSVYWDYKKTTAKQNLTPESMIPLSAKTILNGLKTQESNAYILENEFKPRVDLFSWNMDILQTGQAANAEDLIQRHQRDYCSLLEYKNGLCVNQVKNPNINDLSAYSLLGDNTLDTSESDKAYNAAFYFLKNITNPTPIPVLPKEKMYINYKQKILSEQGRDNLLAKYKQEAILSLAQNGLLGMLLDRVPASQDETGKQYSRLALLENESLRRFASKDWHLEINKAPSTALLREMTNMMAFSLVMQYRDSQRLERIEAVLDTQLANLTQLSSGSVSTQQKLDALEKHEGA